MRPGMDDFRGALLVDNWKPVVYSHLPVRYELCNFATILRKKDNQADRERQRIQEMLAKFNEYAREITPSLYLQDAAKPRKRTVPF
jgi:hypothetical protein